MTAVEFCGIVNELIARGLQLTPPTDDQRRGMFITLQNRVNLITSVGPEHLIEKIGPALYKYKDPIKKRDENFFMTLEIKPPPTLNDESAKMLVTFGESIRRMYASAEKTEKTEVYTKIKSLLRIYVSYMLSKK